MGCCEWCSTHFRAPFRWIVCMIEIGIAIAIINIVYWHLTDLDVAISSAEVVNYQCLLAPQDKADDLCVYAYVLCGASLVVCIILMVTVCLKCACWLYFDFWVDFAFTLAGVVWWLAGSLVLSAYAAKTNDQNDIQQSYRNSVTVLAWIMTLCFFLDYIVSQSRLCYKVCGCCGGKAEKERLAAEKAKEKEEAERKKLEEQGGDIENPPKEVVPPELASELGKTPSASQPSAAKPSTTATAASAPSAAAPAASAPSTAAPGNVTVEVVK